MLFYESSTYSHLAPLLNTLETIDNIIKKQKSLALDFVLDSMRCSENVNTKAGMYSLMFGLSIVLLIRFFND